MPVPDPTVATVIFPLVQVPPLTLLLRVADAPTHIDVLPLIVPGAARTVTVANAVQPVVLVYVMTAVPLLTPVMIPEKKPAVAMPVALLLQVPPVVALLSVVVVPAHNTLVPVMAAGDVLTVTVATATHKPT